MSSSNSSSSKACEAIIFPTDESIGGTNSCGLRQRRNTSVKKDCLERRWDTNEDDSDTEPPSVEDSASGSFESEAGSFDSSSKESFFAFRLQYLIVHIAIMLADGMQGKFLLT
jgi:hypothetical protein